MSIYVYLCLSMPIYVYLCLSNSIYVYLCLSVSIYVYLCLCIYVCLSIYLSMYVCMHGCMHAWMVWSGLVWSGLVWSGLVWSGLVCMYVYLCLSMFIYVYLCLSMFIYAYLFLSISIYVYLFLSTSTYIYLSQNAHTILGTCIQIVPAQHALALFFVAMLCSTDHPLQSDCNALILSPFSHACFQVFVKALLEGGLRSVVYLAFRPSYASTTESIGADSTGWLEWLNDDEEDCLGCVCGPSLKDVWGSWVHSRFCWHLWWRAVLDCTHKTCSKLLISWLLEGL